MKKIFFYSVTILINVVASVLVTNFLLFAMEQKSHTLTITATVRPMRIIIIDKDLIIQKIISNTKEDVRPIVVLDSADGSELPYSESIAREYEFLKPSLNFSQPGIIYEREERPVQAVIKRGIRTIAKLLVFPF